jgi:arsenate reductase
LISFKTKFTIKKILSSTICTHNSRRSHLSQVWAKRQRHIQHKNVFSYSGGTEETALYPMAAQTLEQSGFKIRVIAAGNNPYLFD